MQSVYSSIEVAKDFYTIEEGGVRMFLIIGEKEALLVDTGFGTGDLISYIRTMTEKPIRLVMTHTDGDHIGKNGEFEKAMMHPAEFDYYRAKGGKNAEAIWEGDLIDLGNYRFRVILIPGHTPGSIALLEENTGLLISGDSIGRMPIYMFNAGRNIDAYIESMKKLDGIKGFTKILTSHGELLQERSIIHELIEAAEAIRKGEVSGEKPERDLPCLLYRYKKVAFLYNP